MLMNWEQTDRVGAETAKDSSSKGALGDSIRFPPGGRRVELFLCRQAAGGWASKLEVKDGTNKSPPPRPPQASSPHQEGSVTGS